MKAVHFGAGNVGRGFIGAVLQDSGYHVVFADVNADVIDSLNSAGHYRVVEIGEGGTTSDYKNFSAINSMLEPQRLRDELATADLITAAVGVNILPRIAPAIAEAILLRELTTPVLVMACENAVNATDLLAEEIAKYGVDQSKVIFCNTAVDRIVPIQDAKLSPDVEVEVFSEWVIETKNLTTSLSIPAAKLVPDLEPFIERKLYTVNTGHCAIAYLGQKAGQLTIATALRDPEIEREVAEVLDETSKALVIKHGFSTSEQSDYVQKTLKRLRNPLLDDLIVRVGRDPIRKISRTERIIGPAVILAEAGVEPKALMDVLEAALEFDIPDDQANLDLQHQLLSLTTADFVTLYMGLSPSDAIWPHALKATEAAKNKQRV
jgi:mannitol-1-phosphate 5-dehydrogenase